jgi:hypothetical protein
MRVEEYIRNNAPRLGYRTMIAPDIPAKKLDNCVKKFVNCNSVEAILLLGDATILGNASIGFAFTGKSFYFANKNNEKNELLLEQIKEAVFIKNKISDSDEYNVGDKIIIYTRDNLQYELNSCLLGFNCKAMETILNGIVSLIDDGADLIETKQNIAISDMDNDVKLVYLKILCNYAYIGDSYIDSKEYSAIQSISVRIETPPEIRNELRTYMSEIEYREKTGNLLFMLKSILEYGSYNIIRFSLTQDVLYLHNLVYPKQRWEQDGFIGSLMKYFGLTFEQIDLMDYAVYLNNQMVSDNVDLIDLKSKSDDLIKSAVSLCIPLMTLYCAGSVYSIDTYHKIFKGEKKAKLSIDKQRELMLQTVVKNTQATINNLVRDMNCVTEQLVAEMNKGVQAKDKIAKLSAMLSRLMKGTSDTVAKTEKAEQQALYASIPKFIEIDKINKFKDNELYAEQTKLILKYYIRNVGNGQLQIKDNMTAKELRGVLETLREIAYI